MSDTPALRCPACGSNDYRNEFDAGWICQNTHCCYYRTGSLEEGFTWLRSELARLTGENQKLRGALKQINHYEASRLLTEGRSWKLIGCDFADIATAALAEPAEGTGGG